MSSLPLWNNVSATGPASEPTASTPLGSAYAGAVVATARSTSRGPARRMQSKFSRPWRDAPLISLRGPLRGWASARAGTHWDVDVGAGTSEAKVREREE